MKEYYGNYLGLCINNDDPEKRGRVQVFIPHIMPALFENWNEDGSDITLTCVGDNLPASLPTPIVEKLKKMLPWAESASPILGISAPGSLASAPSYSQAPSENFYSQTPVPDAAGYAGGVTGGGASPEGAIATISPTDGASSGAHLDVRWRGKTRTPGGPIEAPSLDLVGKYIQVGGIPANQLRVTDGPTGPGGRNFGSGRSFARHPAWDLAFRTPGAIAGAPVTLTNGARVIGGGNTSYGSAYAHIETPEGVLELLHLTTNSVKAGGSSIGSATQGSGRESPSTSGQLAAATPHQSPNPIGSSTSEPSRYGSIADPAVGGGGGAAPGITGNMSSSFKSQYQRVYDSLEGSKFIGTVPNDGARYGITTGSRQEWTHFFTRLASVESGFNPNTAADINGRRNGPLTSFGLYQMGSAQFNTYGGGGNIYNSSDNTRAFVRYAESMYFGGGSYGRGGGNNVISGRSGNGWLGIAAGYGPLRRTLTGSQNQNESQLLAANIAASERQTGSYSTGPADIAAGQPPTLADGPPSAPTSQMVQNIDPHGPAAVMDLNNMAAGMFSYPAAGALLWCFFREGNPLYPVYFAASYGQTEWQSAYRYNVASPAQDGVGYKPSASSENPVTSVGGTWNIGKVGAIAWTDEVDPNDPTKNQKYLMITGHDGSNIFFNEGYHQLFSKFDRRDQVEGDRWETTLGQKEEWVQGDSNTVVMGDMFVKIGNVGPEAVEAVERIQTIIKDSMQPLTTPRDCSLAGTGSSTTKPASKFKKQAESKSKLMDRNAPAAGRNTSFDIPAIKAQQEQQIMQAGRLAPASGRNSSFNISAMVAEARGSTINPANYNTGAGRIGTPRSSTSFRVVP